MTLGANDSIYRYTDKLAEILEQVQHTIDDAALFLTNVFLNSDLFEGRRKEAYKIYLRILSQLEINNDADSGLTHGYRHRVKNPVRVLRRLLYYRRAFRIVRKRTILSNSQIDQLLAELASRTTRPVSITIPVHMSARKYKTWWTSFRLLFRRLAQFFRFY